MKKLLYTLILVLPIIVLGQSTDQNYVKSTTYKKAIQTTVGVSEADKIEQVTYYDGLGRPMQTNAYKAGGVKAPINELTYDWKSGNLTTGFFNKIGLDSENLIEEGQTPFGDTDLLWRCGNDVTSDADGGWNTDQFAVDNTQTYRYTTWVKRTGDITNGYTYHGTQYVNNLDDTPNVNPYFWYGKLPQVDTWYLLVGIVHPHTYIGVNSGESGVYDINGTKVFDGTDYKWKPTSTTSYFRNYLYYCTDISSRQYFHKPLLQKTSGEEWTVSNIIDNVSANDIVSHIEYDAIGRQVKTHLPYATIGAGSLDYRTDALTSTNNYYQTNYPTEINSIVPNPFSEIEYEASPLNKVLQQGAPGEDWSLTSGHTVKFDYQTNIIDEVRNYGVSFPDPNNTEAPELVLHGNYNPNELYKTITKDENWVITDGLNRTTEEFKDKLGRVILKRTYSLNASNTAIAHDTQYAYDKFGNLTYVLSPKGADIVVTQNLYNDFSNPILAGSFVPAGGKSSPSGVGATIISLTGTTLTLNVNAQFSSPTPLKSGAIYQLSGVVPDVNFNTEATLNGYNFTIANGYLTVFYTAAQWGGTPTLVSSLNGTFTVELEEYKIHEDVIDDLCYQYKYDYRNRLVEKKIPQKGWEYIIYDKLDRPRLTQDANLATTNNWLFTKYDAFGRVTYTGKKSYTSPTNATGTLLRRELQTNLDAHAVLNETRVGKYSLGSDTHFEYTNVSYPIVGDDVLTVNYYDSYTKEVGIKFGSRIPSSSPYKILDGGDDQYVIHDAKYFKTLATASKVRVLGTDDWIFSATYYDKKARPLFIASENGYLKTTDYILNELDFVGNLTATQSEHIKEGKATITVVDGFTYDHQNRLVTQKQLINDGGWETIVSNEYDALGQLVKKDVGNSRSNPLQTVDYKYNVRGWLKQINDVANLNNDLFSFKLNYNTVEGDWNTIPTNTSKLYNGNISQTIWNTANDGEQKSYAYTYDGLNRINEAHTRKGSLLATDMMFDLSGVNYDKNGNILNLNRNNLTEAIDDLDYVYDGNQLTKVTDLISTNTEGFKDGTNTDPDYTYDANGNMVKDQNKEITSISYNHLNLPESVQFIYAVADANGNTGGTINYVYDATGVKLSKNVVTQNTTTVPEKTTQYAGNYVYEGVSIDNTALQFFNHPEGYVEPTSNTSRPFQYIYQFKDHLGNIRLSYRDQTGEYEVLDDSDFTGNVTNGWSQYSAGTITPANERLKVSSTENTVTTYKEYMGVNGANQKLTIDLDVDTGSDTNNVYLIIQEKDANNQGLTWVYDGAIQTGHFSTVYTTTDPSTTQVKIFIQKGNSQIGTETYFTVDNINITSGELEIMEESNYYPFGLKHKGYNNVITGRDHPYGFGGMEENSELGLDWLDFGARNYDVSLGRWMNLDPASDLLESSSPYVYALNCPIVYLDLDGELPILINGRVSSDDERGSEKYWASEIIETIKGSGIANPGGQFHYVDGDRGYDVYFRSQRGNLVTPNKDGKNGPSSSKNRKTAGSAAASRDFQSIIDKLEKDPKTGKITEKIQIYTHSRGAAFGVGYTEKLLTLIKKNSTLFADANNVIEFSLNLAPHQSDEFSAAKGVETFGISHRSDGLSGNDIKGADNVHSNPGNIFSSHGNASFKNELKSFVDAFSSSGGANAAAIDKFKKALEAQGIKFTYKEK